MSRPRGVAGRIAAAFIDSRLTPLLVLAAIGLGSGRGAALPREEEPQIIVPMIDVFVQMPGASPAKSRSASRGRWRSCSGRSRASSTSTRPRARDALDGRRPLLRRAGRRAEHRPPQSEAARQHRPHPARRSPPLVKPRSIDDVPILALTLSGRRYGDIELRRSPHSCTTPSRRCPMSPRSRSSAAAPRQVTRRSRSGAAGAVRPRSARRSTGRSSASNALLPRLGRRPANARTRPSRPAQFLRRADDVRNVVVGVADGPPVLPRATSPTCATATTSPPRTSRSTREPTAPSRRDDRRREAQGHQRHRRHATASSRSSSRCTATIVPADVHDDHHPPLRRDRAPRSRTSCSSTC